MLRLGILGLDVRKKVNLQKKKIDLCHRHALGISVKLLREYVDRNKPLKEIEQMSDEELKAVAKEILIGSIIFGEL